MGTIREILESPIAFNFFVYYYEKSWCTKERAAMKVPSINVIIFDLSGVVFALHKMQIVRNVVSKDLIRYLLKERKNPIDEGIMILDKMRKEVPGQFQDVFLIKGLIALFIVQWNQGQLTRAQALDKYSEIILMSLISNTILKMRRIKRCFLIFCMSIFGSEKVLKLSNP